MHGAYNAHEASLDHNLHMLGLKTDSMMEMTYAGPQQRVHNLKYYTWVEQQARDVKDLNALWYDTQEHPGTPSTPRPRIWTTSSTSSTRPLVLLKAPVRRHGAGALPPHLFFASTAPGRRIWPMRS